MHFVTLALLLSSATPMRVAVLPFDNDTKDARFDGLERGLADLVIADLAGTPNVELVERLRLDDVRKELKLQRGRDFDPRARVELGKLLGATHGLFGSLVAVAPKVSLLVRVVDLKKNTVLVTAKVEGSPDDLFELERALIEQLINALISGKRQTPNPGSGHPSVDGLLAYSAGVTSVDGGDLQAAQSKLAEAVRLSPDFQLAKDQYADVMKRLREAKKKRGGVQDDAVAKLTARLTGYLGKPPAARALGARIALANLALLQLQRLVNGKKDQAAWISPAQREEAAVFERAFVTHAGALVDELASLKGAEAKVELPDEDTKLGEATFDVSLAEWDYVTASNVATDLGRFLGSGWSPYRSGVAEFAARPSAAQRGAAGVSEARQWFERARKELARETGDVRAKDASQLANEHAEFLVIIGRREEAVAQWQGFLDSDPAAKDFPEFARKVEAVMLLDDQAELDEKRLAGCDAALLDDSARLASRTWRAKGVKGLLALGDALRKCGTKDAKFTRASWSIVATELKRVADCDAFTELRVSSGVELGTCP